MSRLYDGSIIEVDGMNFKVTLEHDGFCEPPWEYCDGHADFDYLRRWCNDDWQYVVLGVSLLDDDDEEMGETEYLGGVEYDCDNTAYVQEEAENMARQIISRIAHTFDVIEPHEEISDDTGYVIAAEYVSI